MSIDTMQVYSPGTRESWQLLSGRLKVTLLIVAIAVQAEKQKHVRSSFVHLCLIPSLQSLA